MSTNTRPLIATIYNPQNQSKEALIAGFVVRKTKFNRLFRDIYDAPMTAPEQHYLIQGLRGMGKTTLLLRLAYEIENTPDLHDKLIPIVFNEEEYGITSLADLWERTAHYLEEADPLFSGLTKNTIACYKQPDYERLAIDTIISALQHHRKNILLLIDNIGDLFKKLDSMEAKRLREVLLTTKELRLIGATSVMLEQTQDYSKPFYEFFKVIHLEELTRQEAIELFSKLGEIYHADVVQQLIRQRPERIEAIRRLTGGVIRTMVLLFDIMVEEDSGSVFKDLNVLLDRVTPLYKHRMDDLPTQQQKIVAALAQAWDAASAKELALAVRLESKVVSAQLQQLTNNGLVEKVETHTKNHLYRLEERFFNIWYLMRFGRKTDQRVLWLIKFFELMFEGNTEWMQEKIDYHLQAMEVGSLDPEAALYLTTAFTEVVKDEVLEDILSRATKIYLITKGHKELASEIGYSKYEKLTALLNERKYREAINNLYHYSNKNLNVYFDLISCYMLIKEEDVAKRLFIELTKRRRKVLRQLITFFEQRSLKGNKRKNKNLLGPYAIYEEFVSITVYPNNLNNIQLKSSTQELKVELMMIYFNNCMNDRKGLALALTESLVSESDEKSNQGIVLNLKIAAAIIYLWNNKYNEPIYLNFGHYLNSTANNATLSSSSWLYTIYLKLLLAKKQYHTVYKYFQQEEWQLKDRYKPLYYATLHFLRDEYAIDYLRMGPELLETVNDVLAEVEQMAKDYA